MRPILVVGAVAIAFNAYGITMMLLHAWPVRTLHIIFKVLAYLLVHNHSSGRE